MLSVKGREDMDHYVTGGVIRALREKKKLTQSALADKIGVSDKAVSKWETGRGLPDITLLEPLAAALGVSVIELMRGEPVVNRNVSANMRRGALYVCPVCGNVLHSLGAAVVSCCGVALPPLEAEEPDAAHEIAIEPVEDEFYVSLRHAMTRGHHISFLAFASDERFELVKLYPEGDAAARFSLRGGGWLYAYCNRHGLVRKRV